MRGSYPLDRNFGIPGPFGHGSLQIFSDATTTLWGRPGSIINLLSYVLRAFWQKLKTVQE
jgi:hypothetical protein